MGLQNIKAVCECGYHVENIQYGCTMILMAKNIDYFPAFCSTCGELNGVNILDKPVTCSKCFSTDIKMYSTPEMLGDIIEPDVSSERFHRCHEVWNETLEMMAQKDGKAFVPVDVDQYRQEVIERHNERIRDAENPIFIHFNYCPECEQYRLKFCEPLFNVHFD
ncbi:MAG: hypothetical protein AB1Z20_09205 [Desulfobacterales bacterium]